jgi:CBS domain-containing protein
MPIRIEVKDLMDNRVFSLDANAMVAQAIDLMIQKNVWSVVVERRGLPEGVVTEKDVFRRCIGNGLDPKKTPIGSIASVPLITVGPDTSIKEAMDVMTQKNIRRVFVVERGKIIGRITQTRLFESMVSVLEDLSLLSSEL